ncbi:hypothetical protein T484DRAFT_2386892 [Baffinella frigidus]|nr:hypothetical protein T484DRAFT_2386892 [Cryptophyta sp. CCMP2293]
MQVMFASRHALFEGDETRRTFPISIRARITADRGASRKNVAPKSSSEAPSLGASTPDTVDLTARDALVGQHDLAPKLSMGEAPSLLQENASAAEAEALGQEDTPTLAPHNVGL